jgi:hypothetical protein
MNRTGDPGFQRPERIPRVFGNPSFIHDAFSVFLDAFRRGLLIAALNAPLRIIPTDRHIAGQYQQRASRGVRGRNGADHVGEAGTFGP